MNAPAHEKSNSLTKGKSRWTWRSIQLLFTGFILWLIVRTFCVQIMYIPSSSMEGTLHEGDRVYVNKLVYGPRIPITILSNPFSDKSYLDWIQIPYTRIPGYDEVRLNDILVFNWPGDTSLPVDVRQLYIKRCVGLPGDSLIIERGNILCNGIQVSEPEFVVRMYSVALKRPENPDSIFDRLKISGEFHSPDGLHYSVRMTDSQRDQLESTGKTNSIALSIVDADRYDYKMFPQNTSKNYRWNSDNFGPILIPRANQTIALSLNNIHLYKTAIVVYEHNELENRHDSIFINGRFAPTYTFKMNYYFVMGDNRYESNDSRFWGFVPEDHLIGRAAKF